MSNERRAMSEFGGPVCRAMPQGAWWPIIADEVTHPWRQRHLGPNDRRSLAATSASSPRTDRRAGRAPFGRIFSRLRRTLTTSPRRRCRNSRRTRWSCSSPRFRFTAGFTWLRVAAPLRETPPAAGTGESRTASTHAPEGRRHCPGRLQFCKSRHRASSYRPGPYTSRAEVTRTIYMTFECSPDSKTLEVVLFGYPGVSKAPGKFRCNKVHTKTGGFASPLKDSRRDVRRFAWVDGLETLQPDDHREELLADEYHFNELAHEMIANAVEAALKRTG